jgi:hypothetical protein
MVKLGGVTMRIGEVPVIHGSDVKIEAANDGTWLALYSCGFEQVVERVGALGPSDELARQIFRAVPEDAWQNGSGWDTAVVDGGVLVDAFEETWERFRNSAEARNQQLVLLGILEETLEPPMNGYSQEDAFTLGI